MMKDMIKIISEKSIQVVISAGNTISNLLYNYNMKRQVEYFKKLGCEVFERDENGKWRKI